MGCLKIHKELNAWTGRLNALLSIEEKTGFCAQKYGGDNEPTTRGEAQVQETRGMSPGGGVSPGCRAAMVLQYESRQGDQWF